MWEHTRKRHTSAFGADSGASVAADIFRVICPVDHAEAVKKYLVSQGCTLEEFVDPATVFPQRSPGTLLRGARNRENLTQQRLADMCGISRHHISEMENGKRTIGRQNARKLGEALGIDPRLFLWITTPA